MTSEAPGANGTAPNGRPPTMQQIAEIASVSLATVSLVLNGKKGTSTATRQRVLDAAREIGYSTTARLPSAVTRTVTLLIERLPTAPTSDPFNRPILTGIQDAARRSGHRIVIEFAGAEDESHAETWSQGWGDGLVILGGGDLGPAWVETALNAKIPVVVVDHFIPGVQVPTIVPDNFAGAYSVTRHLIDMGHSRIGFIRGPSKYWTLGERQAGYLLAMQQAGLAVPAELVPPRTSHGSEKGYLEMKQLLALDEPPTAVFAVSDRTAMNAYRAATEDGLSIPDDISIVGFDDTDAAHMLAPALTTVRNPGHDLGQVAFARLLGLMNGSEPIGSIPIKWTIPTTLMIRNSVRRIS